MLSRYEKLLTTRPVATQAVSACVLWVLGDSAAQQIEHHMAQKTAKELSLSEEKGNTLMVQEPFKMDWKRVGRMGVYGLCVGGPITAIWYRFLDKKTLHLAAKGVIPYVGTKILLDQTVFELPFLAVFFGVSNLLQGKSFKDYQEKLKDEYVDTYLTDCMVWPGIQAVNFALLPVKYQALSVNVVCILWNAFLSYQSNKAAKEIHHTPLTR